MKAHRHSPLNPRRKATAPPGAGSGLGRGPRRRVRRSGFTLIEMLVVVAILGILMTVAIPSLYRQLHPESMQKAVSDILDACRYARAYAVLQGVPVDLVFRSEDGSISIHPVRGGRTGAGAATGGAGGSTGGEKAAAHRASDEALRFRAHLSEKIAIELMEVNFVDQMDFAETHVRFYPNGTCDEFKLLLYKPETNERRLITLEVVTGLPMVESDLLKMR